MSCVSLGRSRRVALLLASWLILTLVACTPPTPYASLDGDLGPLQAAFNADVGRTRVLMLVAPT